MNPILRSVIVRIALRYISGALVAKGVLDTSMADVIALDPDITALLEIALGAIIGAVTEWYYRVAKKVGGPT